MKCCSRKNEQEIKVTSEENEVDGVNKPIENEEKLEKHIKLNYACLCLFFFLTGSDFAVIIPTLWDRLHIDFNSSGSFMGVVISAYSASGVICGLIMGRLSDDIHTTKPFYLVAICLSIIGHLLYFVGINKYVILIARAISGMCLGSTTVSLAYVARTTNEKQRTSIISIVMASRQIGLMLGPAFNLFLRKTNFKLFNRFLVDRKSSPGLFMALIWALSFLIFLIFFNDSQSSKKNKNSSKQYSLSSKELNQVDDTEIDELVVSNDINNKIQQTDKENNSRKLKYEIYKKEFFRLEIFVMLITTFFTYFNQTSLETMVIPFTELMFGWTELENSILFCVCGCTIILSFFGLKLLSLKFKDRFIILLGLISITTGLIIACSCLPFAKQLQNPANLQISLYKSKTNKNLSVNKNENQTSLSSYLKSDEIDGFDLVNTTVSYFNDSMGISYDVYQKRNRMASQESKTYDSTSSTQPHYDYTFFPAFIIFVTFDIVGLPAVAITSASLFTKLIDNKVQGLGQGLQRGILGLGTLFGPLCAGPFVQRPLYLLGFTLSFVVVILALFIISYSRLKPKSLSK